MPELQDGIAGISSRAKKAREEMRRWYPLLEELAHYFHQNRKGFQVNYTEGHEFGLDIWDSSPEGHRTKLSQAFVDAMCPSDRYWVGMRPARDVLMQIDRVRLWCQVAAKMMYKAIYDTRAGFSESINELADDSSTFGTAVMYIDHNRVDRHLVFQVKHLKNFAFEVNANGKLVRCYCWWSMCLDDLVTEFGLENLPVEFQEMYRDGTSSNSDAKYEVVHAVIPSEDHARFGLAPNRLPFKSLWILCNGNHLLDEGGYHEMPYILVRWYRRSGEALGRCDAMRGLADARLIQSVAAALLEITEKQSNPPMQMPIDIIRGDLELWPGGANFFDASGFQYQGDPIRPIEIGSNPAMTAEFLQHLDRKLGKIFFADLLNLPEDGMDEQRHLAMEMMKAVILAPIWSRVEDETLPPILDRVFGIMFRARAFPPIPDELAGEQLIYEYDNKIADMREMAKAQSAFNAISMPLQLERPEALENVDWDTAFRGLYQMMKVPQNWILPLERVVAERQQRQQMEQAQQAAELAKAGGPGVKQAIEGAVTARDQGLLPAQ